MSENTNGKSKTIGVIVIVVVVIALLAGGYYFIIYKPAEEAKEKARLEAIAKKEAEKKRKEQAAQKKARYDKLIEDADAEVGQENWDIAFSLYSDAAGLFPNEQYAQDQLTMVQSKLDEIAALEERKAAGIVETVSSATDRYYIIISSSIDDDLAMDYANKLVQEGNYVKILEPLSTEKPFYRVSLGDYDTQAEAESASASFSSFGDGIWILKY